MAPRVPSSMVLAVGLAVCLVACGGKGKDAKTTPDKVAGSDDPSMKDPGDPTGGPGATPGSDPANPGGPGAGPGGSPTGPGGGPDPTGPAVIPPNLDPDPAQAKTQVDAHLTIAKTALAQPVPDPEKALAEARNAL